MQRKIESVVDSFHGVGLYRPLIANEFNPLNKTVYNYSASYAVPVHGIAFEKNIGAYESPLYKSYEGIIDSDEFKKTTYINYEDKKVIKQPTELNMEEILGNTDEDKILNFKQIPREMALVKASRLRSFWFQEIDIVENIKNIFKNKKQIL